MNIRKIIEEELKNLLNEAVLPGDSAKNALPSLQAFHEYVGSLTPEQLANRRIYYLYSPNEMYVSIYNKLGKQIRVISPEDYMQFADQEKLAAQSKKRSFGSECDFAEFIQEQIKTKVNITNPVLLRKLSDRKMGYVTASVVNFLVDYARRNNIKADVKPIAHNRQAYLNVCKTNGPYEHQEFKKLFDAVPAEEIKKVIATSYAQSAAASGASVIDADKLPSNVLQPLRTAWYQTGVDREDSFTKLYKKDNKWFFQGLQSSQTAPVPENFYQALESIVNPATTSGTLQPIAAAQQPQPAMGTKNNPFPSPESAKPMTPEMQKNGYFYKERGYLKQAIPTPGDPNSFDIKNLGLLPTDQRESKALRGMILKELLSALK